MSNDALSSRSGATEGCPTSEYIASKLDLIEPSTASASVGGTRDPYDNALPETVIGLCKTEVIWRTGVDWFDNRRHSRSTRRDPAWSNWSKGTIEETSHAMVA